MSFQILSRLKFRHTQKSYLRTAEHVHEPALSQRKIPTYVPVRCPIDIELVLDWPVHFSLTSVVSQKLVTTNYYP